MFVTEDLKKLRLTRLQMAAMGGCHGKLAGTLLEQLLAADCESRMADPSASLQTREDSALIEVDKLSFLFSTDLIFLPGTSLYDSGRIGALHSFGDIYASGGVAKWALVTLIVDGNQPLNHAEAVMQGVRDASSIEDVSIVGGHTVNGKEAMVGLSVIGIANKPPLRKLGARPGDKLFLSKQLGTGICLSAYKHGLCDEAALAESIETMLISSKQASLTAQQSGATACTDVTGFGLIGHLSEMLSQTVGVELITSSIPILPFAQHPPRSLAESRSIKSNYEYATSRVEVKLPAALHDFAALFDPQTNGPLLVAAPDSASTLLLSDGYVPIGQFTEEPGLVLK